MGILRLAHVDVRMPDLDLATAYYTEVMGLHQVSRDGRPRSTSSAGTRRTTTRCGCATTPRIGLDLFTFRVEQRGRPARPREAARRYGCQVARVSRGEAVGQGESIRFETPSGQTMELVCDVEKIGGLLGKRQPVAGAAAGPAGHRAAAHRPRARQRRGGRRGAPASSRRCSASASPSSCSTATATSSASGWSARTPRTTSPSSTAPTAACTTSPSGSTTGTTCARPPTSSPTTASRSTSGPDPPRRHPGQHDLLLRPARHPQRGVHRRLPRRTPTSRRSPGPRTSSAAALFYYENVLNAALPEGAHLRRAP